MFMGAGGFVIFTAIWEELHFWLVDEAEEMDVMVGAFVVVTELQAALVFVLFRGPGVSASRHRVSCAESLKTPYATEPSKSPLASPQSAPEPTLGMKRIKRASI